MIRIKDVTVLFIDDEDIFSHVKNLDDLNHRMVFSPQEVQTHALVIYQGRLGTKVIKSRYQLNRDKSNDERRVFKGVRREVGDDRGRTQ